nr:sin3 histone deacetylase corepressor complex component SDS3 isoform X3 [Mirounga angustirostris]
MTHEKLRLREGKGLAQFKWLICSPNFSSVFAFPNSPSLTCLDAGSFMLIPVTPTWDYFLLNQLAHRNLRLFRLGTSHSFLTFTATPPIISQHTSYPSTLLRCLQFLEHWMLPHASVPLPMLFPLSGTLFPPPPSIGGQLRLIFMTQVAFYTFRKTFLPWSSSQTEKEASPLHTEHPCYNHTTLLRLIGSPLCCRIRVSSGRVMPFKPRDFIANPPHGAWHSEGPQQPWAYVSFSVLIEGEVDAAETESPPTFQCHVCSRTAGIQTARESISKLTPWKAPKVLSHDSFQVSGKDHIKSQLQAVLCYLLQIFSVANVIDLTVYFPRRISSN